MKDRIIVVGGGAIGCFLAAKLMLAGQEVTLIARGARAQALRDQGLLLELGTATERVLVPVSERCAGMEPADLIVLCTKMEGLAAALELARPVTTSSTCFVTVQNGVEAHHKVAETYPQATVVASRVHGFFEMDQNRVRHVGVPPSLACGVTAGPMLDAARSVATLLERSGIAATEADDIHSDMWQKFLLAASLGGAGLALGKPAGSLHADGEGALLLAEAMEEVARLAKARGIALPPDIVARTLAFVETFPPDATTSLQRDVEAGRPSEYDSLTGAVLRLARSENLDLPVFSRIERQIRARGLLA